MQLSGFRLQCGVSKGAYLRNPDKQGLWYGLETWGSVNSGCDINNFNTINKARKMSSYLQASEFSISSSVEDDVPELHVEKWGNNH